MPMSPQRDTDVEEPPELDEEDEAILDEVWARIAAEEEADQQPPVKDQSDATRA